VIDLWHLCLRIREAGNVDVTESRMA